MLILTLKMKMRQTNCSSGIQPEQMSLVILKYQNNSNTVIYLL